MEYSFEKLKGLGFEGFVTMKELVSDLSIVPLSQGVYYVLRTSKEPPTFLKVSTGGHFKGKDPTVNEIELKKNWIEGCPLVYIGKADSLRERLTQFIQFGCGEPIGHWGGRLIWQLKDSADLVVSWRKTKLEAEVVESMLLDEFKSEYGAYPFANLRGSRKKDLAHKKEAHNEIYQH